MNVPAPEPPVARLAGVTRCFHSRAEEVVAVDDVTLELRRGEVVALVGPSGSGKTTVLNLLLGWERPDSGHVERSYDPAGGWAAQAVVPQDLGLLEELTVRENVTIASRLCGAAPRPVDDLLAELGLAALADRLPRELSVGEQQRTAVARAVSCSPLLLAADEPTAHQDERHADMVMDVLAEVAAGGGAVLVLTHDTRLMDAVDRVVSILDGRVVEPVSPR
jgi:putative ABC transport system ATP-binding protein